VTEQLSSCFSTSHNSHNISRATIYRHRIFHFISADCI